MLDECAEGSVLVGHDTARLARTEPESKRNKLLTEDYQLLALSGADFSAERQCSFPLPFSHLYGLIHEFPYLRPFPSILVNTHQ
jgi:hypothetical protein